MTDPSSTLQSDSTTAEQTTALVDPASNEPTQAQAWFVKHQNRLLAADAACRERTAYSPFIESPRRSLHPDGAKEAGLTWFKSTMGKFLGNTAPGASNTFVADESSPYSRDPLGVHYAQPNVDLIFDAALSAWPAWKHTSPAERMGVCLEALDRLSADLFANAFATMHTTGQPFIMAFAGSGANSLDRGLEALVYAHRAMSDVPASAQFQRSFGGGDVQLNKRYRIMPRGVAIVITCGSYPAWNAYPAIFANLATGNPVVVKPHPTTVLPVARAVQIIRQTIGDAGFDPNLIVLATDTPDEPITDALVNHPATAIIDFTGSPQYGQTLEARADRLVYTETAGCNAVILESAHDLDAVLAALARGLCLFSGQMCTTPQNIFIPPVVQTDQGEVSYEQVRARLVAKIDELADNPTQATAVFGALHSQTTLDRIDALAVQADENEILVIRGSSPFENPDYPQARTKTPLVLEDDPDSAHHQSEQFGPVVFLIPTRDRDEALARASLEAQEFGAIASYAYTTDPGFATQIEERFFDAGGSIGINLINQSPINFTAAFSDYHVTGLNPAGNACLTDLAFVANRFRIVQSKTELLRHR